jgi:uncharacterized protein with PIN domain
VAKVTFHFFGELNDFLPLDLRQKPFRFPFNGPQSVKHLMEALGVPHTEVAAIMAGGEAVSLSYLPSDGLHIAVYPEPLVANIDALDSQELPLLRPPLPDPPAFLADNHLGRLTRYLRLLGIDTAYGDSQDDEELAHWAARENRVMLTRDRGLLKRRQVVWGQCLRATGSREQLHEVIRRFDLQQSFAPWSRCLRCNGNLRPVEKAAVLDRLESKTRLYYDEFRLCADCGRVYWRGSHFGHMAALVAEVTGRSA